tara:strand:+ start:8864 stop:9361 length:498 start_codon:yes stop_codon:yes gene_type:complete
MKLRTIVENIDNSSVNEYIIELAFVGPKSQNQSRSFGHYQLPHNLQTINSELLDNPEYYERCVVFDLTNDKTASKLLQTLKPYFKKYGVDHAELVLVYDEEGGTETIKPSYGGATIPNATKIEQEWGYSDINHGYLLLYDKDGKTVKKLPLSKDYAYAAFQEVQL